MDEAARPGHGSSESLYFIERGSGPPLLPVHGLMVTGEMFDPVVEALAKRHRLVIPDLRGHGRSGHLPPPYTPVQLASDLDRLLGQLGIESASVLGYSMGGAIAQQFAVDYPKRCNRLVLASTYACATTTFAEKVGASLVILPLVRVLGMRRFARFVVLAGTRQLNEERADWLVGLIAGQDRKVMLTVTRETVIRFDSRRRLGEVKCPTLVIAGPLDRGDLRQAKMLHGGITGSELVLMDHADHALIWAHTDDFVQIVDSFLND